jgi:DNA-binding NarL/FixJ family response regulator
MSRKPAVASKIAPRIRLAIVDDHPMIRRGVRLTFGDLADFEVVGEGASADDAVQLAQSVKPDVILIDVSLPGDGIDAVRRITEALPSIRICVLTIHDDLATVRRSLRAGATGFVSKGTEGDELVASVRRMARGERYISPELAVRLIEDGREDVATHGKDRSSVPLSKRERELLDLLGEGLSNAAISERTGLAENTVKQYVSALIQKLGVRNRTAAALLAQGASNRSN